MQKKNGNHRAEEWLEQAYPEMHYLLLALEGAADALPWLKENSPGVGVLARALTGRKKALAELHAEEPVDLDDLFELLDNEDLATWLLQRRPDLHVLFQAIKGDEAAAGRLKRARPGRAELAVVIRELYEGHLRKLRDGGDLALEGAAADVACLTGEMHLSQGDYDKAVTAFTRAIETQPAPDLYEGRARAYRALAEDDERRAESLRPRC